MVTHLFFEGERYRFEIAYAERYFKIVATADNGCTSTINNLNEIISAFIDEDLTANDWQDWEGTPEEVVSWVETARSLFADPAFVTSLEKALDKDRLEDEWGQ